ncbi:hypothetical protein Hte_003090 [Hypoxylon texense]
MTEASVSDNHQQETSTSSSQASEEDEIFSDVIAAIKLDSLSPLARSVRQRIDSQYDGLAPQIDKAIFGSYHMLFPIRFADGVSWIAKIPQNGTEDKWDKLSAGALRSEAQTMRLLKRETTIPLPEVFQFSPSTKNCLRCPYILMSYVTGKSLYDVWFAHRLGNASQEDVMRWRAKALAGIGAAMAQLDKFSYDQGGRLVFDKEGQNVIGIGPSRSIDDKAMLDRWFIHNDPCDDMIYVEDPVVYGTDSYYLGPLTRHPEEHPFGRGVLLLLHWLINERNKYEQKSDRPFVLAHPDFDIQNFIVADDGELLGIIDWDGVTAVPRSVGNLRYPGWITRDWDPAMYGYKESMDAGVKPEGVWEDSPAELARCRTLYRHTMKMFHGNNYDESVTRMSLIMENLAIATKSPVCRNGILTKIIEEMRNMDTRYDVDFFDLVDGFAQDKPDAGLLERVRNGLRKLLEFDNL